MTRSVSGLRFVISSGSSAKPDIFDATYEAAD